uniref:toxin-antitoxin system TumE family protein n=1 Tax=Candidatus Electrothrix sp. TaxID=2170559 RepID=UPI0040573219
MLNSYIQHIKNSLCSYAWIESVDFLRFERTETDQEKILLYRIRVHLAQEDLLEVCERLSEPRDTGELKRTKYHFHWQDQHNQLIRRWDNAPHHPEIKTFPDHVHVGPENTCLACEAYSLP